MAVRLSNKLQQFQIKLVICDAIKERKKKLEMKQNPKIEEKKLDAEKKSFNHA